MRELGILLLVAIAAMGILLIILLHKITILKKQTDDIVQEVKTYVAYVMMEDATGVEHLTSKAQKQLNREEAESGIIQAVLGEYFP